MKTKLVSFIIALMGLASCAPLNFYQVYKVQADTNIKQPDSHSLVYENEDCRIIYDFWEVGGNVGFIFENKTNNTIYLNLEECFFIKNGFAYDYYKNKTITQTAIQSNRLKTQASLGQQKEQSSSEENSTTLTQRNVLLVPAKSAKIISEYLVINEVEDAYRDCSLFRFPTNKDGVQTEKFTKETSPYVFSNRLSYHIGSTGENLNIENSFYISEINNMTEKYFFKYQDDEFCGEKSLVRVPIPVYKSSNSFYLNYFKTMGDYSFSH